MARKGEKLSAETKQKMSQAKLGDRSRFWKGDMVGYHGVHIWMRKTFGKPSLCDHCGTTTAKKFNWANISLKYRRLRSDWLRLCQSCHIKFDKGLAFPQLVRKKSLD
jgi:hypothetical protein